MTTFKGDAAKFTGKSEFLYGKMFYEVEIIEGHLKGQFKLVADALKESK